MNTSALVLLALCCCSSLAVPVPDRRLRQTDRNATDAAASAAETDQLFDSALNALADTKYDDNDDDAVTEDREKRQLSFVQGKLLNFLKPLPVVDVTREEDKYGNDGDKFNRIGRGVIGGVETVSNMLTSALSFPVDTAKKLSRTATEMLNNLGGRLIGLQ
uniref:RxLR effector protein n=1 Tax=Schizaphis graminum TaxID=13262 RepID=A0A2S2N8E2_SCHGA